MRLTVLLYNVMVLFREIHFLLSSTTLDPLRLAVLDLKPWFSAVTKHNSSTGHFIHPTSPERMIVYGSKSGTVPICL